MTVDEAFEVQKIRFTLWLEKHQLADINPIRKDGVDLEKLLPLCICEDSKHNLALHAIWFLEKYAQSHPTQLPYLFDFLVANHTRMSIEGAKRILGNIYLQALKSSTHFVPTPDQDEKLINCGFDWLTTPGIPIAVVANSFDLLYTLSRRHEWIKEALEAEINLLLDRGTTPAIRSRGQKVLKQLRRSSKSE